MPRILAQPEPGSPLRAITGPRTLPFAGAIRLQRDPVRYAAQLRRDHGDLAFTTALGRDIVVAQGPAAAAELVRDPHHAFANAPVYGFALGRLFERGILLRDFEDHRLHRRILQQAFGREQLAGYLRDMQPLVDDAIARFPTGAVSDVRGPLKVLALDIASEIFVGERLPPDVADRINRAYVDLIEAAGALVRVRIPGLAWDRGHRARRVVDDFFTELLPRRRADPGPDLFSALCTAADDGEVLSDAEVIDHMRFMLFAAHDTATIALTAMTYQLGKHPDWQRRLRAEALAMPASLTGDDLDAMTDMDLVMREALRLRPPVPVIPRAAVRDTELAGHLIPAGTFVLALIGANHRLPDVWDDPDVFDPERFTPERAEHRQERMKWMPFGGGAHHCIGMQVARLEVFTVIHRMLRSYTWSVPDDHDLDSRDRSIAGNAGFPATVEARVPATAR